MNDPALAALRAENRRLREQLERTQRIGALRGEVLLGEVVDALVAVGAAAEHGHQGAKAIMTELHGALERSKGQARGLSLP